MFDIDHDLGYNIKYAYMFGTQYIVLSVLVMQKYAKFNFCPNALEIKLLIQSTNKITHFLVKIKFKRN